MTGWTAKRFWRRADAAPVAGGYAVMLDTRPLRTPAKAPLTLPTLALARAVAAEWQAVEGAVNPAAMPMTRLANAAVDKVGPQAAEVAALLSAYAETDLLCHRAAAPAGLAARQAAGWDPLLAWAAEALGAPLAVTEGVIAVAQPPASLARLAACVAALDPFRLSAFHDLVAIPGSLVLGLAVAHGRLDAATAFALSRIDEDWQAELWGEDAEALAAAARRRADHAQAARFFALCGEQDC